MGEVYAATDTQQGGEVAIKLLNPQLAKEEKHLARFQREAEVTSLLRHPHVVEALDSGVDDDGTPYLVMQLVRGKSLSAYMRERGGEPLGVSVVVSIARQILSALSAAAEINVIHRDLKPGNVMIEETGGQLQVRVVDFGLARFLRSSTYQTLTLTGQVLGTPSFMAPEQAFGDRVEATADIFSVGAIMYALLTGAPPFGKGPEVLARLLNDERTPLGESHPELGPIAGIVDRCLAHSPEERYPTATALDRELARFEGGKTTVMEWKRPVDLPSLVLEPDSILDVSPPTPTALPAEADEQPARPQRRPILLIAAAFVACAVGIVTVALILRSEQRSEGTTVPDPVAPPTVSPVVLGGGVRRTDRAADGGAGAEDAGAVEVADVEEEARHSGAGAGMGDRAPGRRCRGVTSSSLELSPSSGHLDTALTGRFRQHLSATDRLCYTTASVRTHSTLEFEIESPGRMRGLHFVDSGELSRHERACVLGVLRGISVGTLVAGDMELDFSGHRVVLELDHEPSCGGP
jgi:serine/threonine-protein kinase